MKKPRQRTQLFVQGQSQLVRRRAGVWTQAISVRVHAPDHSPIVGDAMTASVPRGKPRGKEKKCTAGLPHGVGWGCRQVHDFECLLLCFILSHPSYLPVTFSVLEDRDYFCLTFCRTTYASCADKYSWWRPQIINTLTNYWCIIFRLFYTTSYARYKWNSSYNSSQSSSSYCIPPLLASTVH